MQKQNEAKTFDFWIDSFKVRDSLFFLKSRALDTSLHCVPLSMTDKVWIASLWLCHCLAMTDNILRNADKVPPYRHCEGDLSPEAIHTFLLLREFTKSNSWQSILIFCELLCGFYFIWIAVQF